MGKKCVLLGLVEAMDFVDEDDRARAVLPCALSIGHHLFDFLDSGKYRAELDEIGARYPGNNLRQRGLASARRSPEDQRTNVVALDLDP